MSIEEALLARARPHMLAERMKEIILQEVSKGSRTEISPEPVALEPVFRVITGPRQLNAGETMMPWVPEPPAPADQLVRLKAWISPKQKCDWLRSELFLKQLSHAHYRVVFEIIGNQKELGIYLLCHHDDLAVIRAAFWGQFELCELIRVAGHPLLGITEQSWEQAHFQEWFPPPPYSHLLTRPDELKRSPYTTILSTMVRIPDPAIGIYQVIFMPVAPEHNWHQNVEALLDLEYQLKLFSGTSDPGRYLQQAPSGPLNAMAGNVEYKAHSDKPFYAAVLRVGALNGGQSTEAILQALAVFTGLIQNGGRPLNHLTQHEFRGQLATPAIRQMFLAGLTHRPGFIVNSSELLSLVHLPPPDTVDNLKVTIAALEPLPPDDSLKTGTPLGICSYAGRDIPVCIPKHMRCNHLHLIGKTGQGKSTVMEYMVLHDISQGHGAIVLDPHGTLVQRLLGLIPREYAERVIYFDPGDSDWVPLWNPIQRIPGQDLGRTAENLVNAFKKIVTNWGDRLENLLRHVFYAALNMPGSTLLDVLNMLRNKTKESDIVREEVLRIVDNEAARGFWLNDYKQYGKDDLGPPKNKLGKLLMSDTVYLMLSQPQCSFQFHEVMDRGLVVLVNLSQVGDQVGELLGCFILELLRLTALTRKDPDSLQPFHIYCDEAHRFLTDAVEGLIAETRKFKVSLTLAHQYMTQFTTDQAGAVSNVGSSIIFNVDTKDAQYLRKDLQNLVEVEDLITQKVGEAIVRIGTHVARMKTRDRLAIPEENCSDWIIANSRRRYYMPVSEVRRIVRERGRRWPQAVPGFDTYYGRPSEAPASPFAGIDPNTLISGRMDHPDVGHDVL